MRPKKRTADGLRNGMAGIVQTADSAGQLQIYRLYTNVGQMRLSVRRQGVMSATARRVPRVPAARHANARKRSPNYFFGWLKA
jgi:hypothetical protein